MIWRIRYRRAPAGAQDGFVEAGTKEKAEAVAQAYCDAQLGCRFVAGSAQPMILADESLLAKPAESKAKAST